MKVMRYQQVLREISRFRPVTDSVDAHSVAYAAQLAQEALDVESQQDKSLLGDCDYRATIERYMR